MSHKIEVFSAKCPLCKETLNNVRKAVEDKGCGCEIIEQVCSGDECCEPAKTYGIKAVPSVVVDGKIAHVGKLSAEEFKQHI